MFSFPRSSRLLKKPNYDFVFKAALRIGSYYFTILYRNNTLTYPRLGLIVAKKTAKRAHDRNRFKRIARESFRSAQHQLPPLDIIVLSKGKIDIAERQSLHTDFENTWKKIQKR